MKIENSTLHINDVKYYVREASLEDEKIIMGLYHSAIGTEFCTWSLDYPNMDTFFTDVNDENLFCICNESGEIIGAVSIDKDENILTDVIILLAFMQFVKCVAQQLNCMTLYTLLF